MPKQQQEVAVSRKKPGLEQQSRNRRRAKQSEKMKKLEAAEAEWSRVHWHLVSRECLTKLRQLDPWTVRPKDPSLLEFLTAAEVAAKIEEGARQLNDIYRWGDGPARRHLRGIWPRILTYCPLPTLRWLIASPAQDAKGDKLGDANACTLLDRFECAIASCPTAAPSIIPRVAPLADRHDLEQLNADDLAMLGSALPPGLYCDRECWHGSYNTAKLATYLFAKPKHPLDWPVGVITRAISNSIMHVVGLKEIAYHVEAALHIDKTAIDAVIVPAIVDSVVFSAPRLEKLLDHIMWINGDDIQHSHDVWLATLYTARLAVSAAIKHATPALAVSSRPVAIDVVIYSFEIGFHTEWLTRIAPPDKLMERIRTIRKSNSWNQTRAFIQLFTALLPPLTEITLEYTWPNTLDLSRIPSKQ